jgi:hypothetical protein
MTGPREDLDDLRAHESRATKNRDEFGLVHQALSGGKGCFASSRKRRKLSRLGPKPSSRRLLD